MRFPEGDQDRLAVLVAVGLEGRTFGKEVADVFESVSPERADVVDGFVTAVAGRENSLTRLVCLAQQVAGLH